jgi:hypothetical protein
MLNTEILHAPHNILRPDTEHNQKIFTQLIFVAFLFIVCDFELKCFRLLQVSSVITATEEIGVRLPGGNTSFSSPKRPGLLCGSLNLLHNWYRGLFPGG